MTPNASFVLDGFMMFSTYTTLFHAGFPGEQELGYKAGWIPPVLQIEAAALLIQYSASCRAIATMPLLRPEAGLFPCRNRTA
jgi:hypothetical protein